MMHRKEIRRLRKDPRVPATIRILVPVLAIVHAIDVVRAVYLTPSRLLNRLPASRSSY